MHAARQRIFNRNYCRRDFVVMDSREGFAKGTAGNCRDRLLAKKLLRGAFAVGTDLALKCNAWKNFCLE